MLADSYIKRVHRSSNEKIYETTRVGTCVPLRVRSCDVCVLCICVWLNNKLPINFQFPVSQKIYSSLLTSISEDVPKERRLFPWKSFKPRRWTEGTRRLPQIAERRSQSVSAVKTSRDTWLQIRFHEIIVSQTCPSGRRNASCEVMTRTVNAIAKLKWNTKYQTFSEKWAPAFIVSIWGFASISIFVYFHKLILGKSNNRAFSLEPFYFQIGQITSNPFVSQNLKVSPNGSVCVTTWNIFILLHFSQFIWVNKDYLILIVFNLKASLFMGSSKSPYENALTQGL